MTEQPEDLDEQPEAVRALVGRTITVTEELSGIPDARPYRFRITAARLTSDPASHIVQVTGDRFRMDGTPAIRKRGPVKNTTVSLMDGWTEVLGLPALPPREWLLEAVGLSSVYSEAQRAGMADGIVDTGAEYRAEGGDVDGQVLPGEELARRVCEALGEAGVSVDRHTDGRRLRLRHRDGRPMMVLVPVDERGTER